MKNNKFERQFDLIRTLVALGISIAIAAVFIFLISATPLDTLTQFLIGPLLKSTRMKNVIETMIPLMFTGVGVSIIYSANQNNMASEGAFYLGGIGASYMAVKFALPMGLHPVVCMLVGGMAGALVCFIPAILYVKKGALPVVSSLMMNYVAFYVGTYFINYIIGDSTAGFPASKLFAKSSKLPRFPKSFGIFHVHIGFIIAILVVMAAYIYLYKTKWGYETRMVGQNASFAKYSGINVMKVVLSCQLIGGFISGFGGAIEQLGMFNRFQYQQLSGHGFDGIMVAIMARYNPKYVPLACFFLSYIRIGADVITRQSDVPVEIISIIQATIIILVCAESFLATWKHRQVVKNSGKSLEVKGERA